MRKKFQRNLFKFGLQEYIEPKIFIHSFIDFIQTEHFSEVDVIVENMFLCQSCNSTFLYN